MQFSLNQNMHASIPESLPVATRRGSVRRRRLRSRSTQVGMTLLFSAAHVMGAGSASAAEIKVGAAQINISTRAVIPMGGYGTFFLKTPRMNGVGIHDPLYASAVVFESAQGSRAAIVVVDAVGLSATQISRIEKAARDAVDPEIHLIVSATHTHQSPDTLGLWGALPKSGRDARYAEQLETATVQAVRDAFARLQPARITQRKGRHFNSTSALSNPLEIQDSFLSLAFYGRNDDRLIGTLTQWSAHPTVLGMENNALSADFIGAFRRSLENAMGVAPHVYLNGVIGKVYPKIPPLGDPTLQEDLFPEGDRDPDVKDTYRNVSTVGYRLAQSVLQADEQPVETSAVEVSTCHVPVRFPVDNSLFRLASNLRVVETRIRDKEIHSRVSAVTVGPVVFVSIPGEAFPKVVNRIPAELFAGREPIWAGVGQDWLGYLIDPEDYDNAQLKYWTDLSVHREGSKVFTTALSRALKGEGCKNFDSVE